MSLKKTRCLVPVLLIFVILFSIGAFSGPSEEEKSGDYRFAGSDYDRRIFGDFRFSRDSRFQQQIYSAIESTIDKDGNGIPSFVPQTRYAVGIIEKYIHDGDRYIAYHISPNKHTDPAVAAPCYAILDTQTEKTTYFPTIESLSDSIQTQGLTFGNWYYTAHANSTEGKRTLLFGDYALEDMRNKYYGRSILFREQPIFYGILHHVRTDGDRYIAFRERRVKNDTAWLFREIVTEDWRIWYDDPITNAMLSESASERVGLFRRSWYEFIPVVYDKYVLWDTQADTVREFDKKGQLDKYCKAQSIALQKEIAR